MKVLGKFFHFQCVTNKKRQSGKMVVFFCAHTEGQSCTLYSDLSAYCPFRGFSGKTKRESRFRMGEKNNPLIGIHLMERGVIRFLLVINSRLIIRNKVINYIHRSSLLDEGHVL